MTLEIYGVNEPRVIQSVDPQHRVLDIFLTAADDNSDSIYEFNEVVGFHGIFRASRILRSSPIVYCKFLVAFPNVQNPDRNPTKISY